MKVRFGVFLLLALSQHVSAAPFLLYSVELPFNYGYAGQPALNNSDQMAILARHGDTYEILHIAESSTQVLYGSVVIQPTGHSGPSGFLPTDPAINSHGEIAFESDSLDSNDFAVYKWTNGSLGTVFSGTTGAERVTQQGLNDDGNIAMGSDDVITVFTNGSANPVDAFSNSRQLTAAIDSQGRLFYARQVRGTLALELRAIDEFGDHLLSSGVAPTGSPFHRHRYSINDMGYAAYVVGLDIYLTSIASPVPTQLSSAPTTIGSLSINDHNDLAFSTVVSSTNGAISHVYYQLDGMGAPEHLLGSGDSFLGGTLAYAIMGSDSLNDHRHLAVGYALTDGTVGVAVFAVPEVSTLVLTLSAALSFLLTRRLLWR